jgi:hypothetical protein
MSDAPHSIDNPAGRELLAAIKSIRRMTSGDPRFHSERTKKEFAAPSLEFLDALQKAARRMPQIYEFDHQHADGIRYTDVTDGERVLNEIIYECQRSLEATGHAKLDCDTREWARARGLKWWGETAGYSQEKAWHDDTHWTGAEIKSCCRLASLLNVPLFQAAQNIVPVAVTAGDKIEALRQWASGRSLSADQAGVYSRPEGAFLPGD